MAFNREKTLHNAQKHAQKGNVDKAIKEYEKVLDEDPGDIRSKLKMADLLVKADRFDEALSAYQEVAYGYANDDLYEKAAAVYKQALRIAPEDPVIHTQLGEAYHRLGRLKDAIRVFHRAQKIYKKDGDETSQRTVLESMVHIDPEDIGLQIQLAERYEKDKLHDDALQLFTDAAAKLKEEGRLDEFVQVAERVIFLRPDYLEMRKEVVRIYLGRGDEKHALKHLQYCFKVTPQDIETLELLGSTFHRLGADQKSLLVYGELAALYERMGEHDRAGSAYRTMLNIDPSHAEARAFLGQEAHPPQQHQRGTEPAYEVADEESEGDALEGIEFLDEDDEADVYVIEEPEPANEGNGFMEFAQDAIAELDPDIDDIEEYPEVEVVPAAPVDPVDELTEILTESEVFLKYGLLDRAEEAITKVIRTDPDHIEGREQMRRLLEKQGNKHGAAHQLVELARITSDNPNRAAGYLQQAAELVDPGVVEMLCDGAGVDESLLRGIEGFDSAFIDEVSEGLDEISGMELEVGEPVGAHTLDIDPDAYGEDEPAEGEPGVYDLDESLFLDPDDELEELDEATDATLQEDSVPSSPPDIGVEPIDATQEDLDVASMNLGATAPDIETPVDAGLDVATDASMSEEHVDEEHVEEMDLGDVEEMDLDDIDEMDLGDVEEMDLGDVEEMDLDDIDEMDFDDMGIDVVDDIEIAVDDDLEVDLEDELALDGADVVDINVDDMNFDENALAALDDSANEGEFDINFSDEDADMMFDELFGGGMFDDDSDGDAGAGSLAFETESSDAEDGPGANGSFGTRSLSQKFDAGVEEVEIKTNSVNNSSLELGKTYKDMGLFAEAIEEFQHAMEDPDAAPAALYNIALCHIELGETEDAADNLTKLSQDESAPNGWRMMAHEKLEELHP